MSEDVFRIVVTAAVVVASLAFVVQAAILYALYRVSRKTQESADRIKVHVEPMLQKVGLVLDHATSLFDKVGPLVEKAGPVIERLGPAIAKASSTMEKIGATVERAMPMIQQVPPVLAEARQVVAKAGTFVERVTDAAATTNLVIADARPNVAQLSKEAMEITRLGREQVERLGGLINDAGDKARARLDQIDHSVEATIEQVQQVSGAMRRAAMRPVREVNGLAAGISAAISTLMGQRKSSVDAATQDEEMFI